MDSLTCSTIMEIMILKLGNIKIVFSLVYLNQVVELQSWVI